MAPTLGTFPESETLVRSLLSIGKIWYDFFSFDEYQDAGKYNNNLISAQEPVPDTVSVDVCEALACTFNEEHSCLYSLGGIGSTWVQVDLWTLEEKENGVTLWQDYKYFRSSWTHAHDFIGNHLTGVQQNSPGDYTTSEKLSNDFDLLPVREITTIGPFKSNEFHPVNEMQKMFCWEWMDAMVVKMYLRLIEECLYDIIWLLMIFNSAGFVYVGKNHKDVSDEVKLFIFLTI